jgi:molecular chaperone GrpE
MARQRTNPRPDAAVERPREDEQEAAANGLSIDVPETLIADALESVNRSTRKGRRTPPPESTPGLDEYTSPEVVPQGQVLDENDMLVVPPELADLVDPVPRGADSPSEAPDADRLRARVARAEDRAGELEGAVVRERAEKERLNGEVLRQSTELTRLRHELREALKSRDALDGMLRETRETARTTSAEYHRLQQRLKREREDAERAGEERGLRALLETSDNLERAFTAANGDTGPLARGIHMVLEQIRGQLRRLGVERVPAAVGTAFDPAIHEAVLHVAASGGAPGTVIDEVGAGYRLRGRLLRPARVTVAAIPEESAQAAADGVGEPAGVTDVLIEDEEPAAEPEAAAPATSATDAEPPPEAPDAETPPGTPGGAGPAGIEST